MKSRPASSASFASARQSSQLADQRSGTVVALRPDEQLAPKRPILSALSLYMAIRDCMDALRASTASYSLTALPMIYSMFAPPLMASPHDRSARPICRPREPAARADDR